MDEYKTPKNGEIRIEKNVPEDIDTVDAEKQRKTNRGNIVNEILDGIKLGKPMANTDEGREDSDPIQEKDKEGPEILAPDSQETNPLP